MKIVCHHPAPRTASPAFMKVALPLELLPRCYRAAPLPLGGTTSAKRNSTINCNERRRLFSRSRSIFSQTHSSLPASNNNSKSFQSCCLRVIGKNIHSKHPLPNPISPFAFSRSFVREAHLKLQDISSSLHCHFLFLSPFCFASSSFANCISL